MYRYDISVIIPTYNAEEYIIKTLNGLRDQTFKGKMEILVIDDCSTDNTIQKVKEFKENNLNLNISILKQKENMRQGTARNRGLRESNGKYIFFLDADDYIDPPALENLYKKAELYDCDFVICDWVYFYEDKGFVYVNNDEFMFNDFLYGKEIESLLKANTYFTVNKLYNRNFLLENNIFYGERYIYEDFEFYVQTAQHAEKVGVIQNPYYKVRVNDKSTTKTNANSTLHIDSLVKAVDNTLSKFSPRSEYSYYHLYKYLMKKTLQYIEKRAPRKYKRKTLYKVVKLLNNKKSDYVVPKKLVPLYHFLFRRKYVQNEKINMILLIWWLHSKKLLRPIFSTLHKYKWLILNSKIVSKIRAKKRKEKIESFYQQKIRNSILFFGFDYRYTGNSKFLFDYLREKGNLEVYFVTKNKEVPAKYRISPRSLKFYEKLAQSKIVIVESWVPLAFKKRDGSIWIQLWHGTPFKKLFFDSSEVHISKLNRNHKKNKHEDIQRWDLLLADSEIGVEKLSSAFDFNKNNIMMYGYPRVQWLKENNSNQALKDKIKEQLDIRNKKVILYAPTWRDYNYKIQHPDFSYLLDVEFLAEKLKDEYVIIYKEHSMGTNRKHSPNIISPDDEFETQELILISDIVLSDYSSIIFDAMALDKPVYLYINDFEKYTKSRGVYEDLHDLLKPFYVDDKTELLNNILHIEETYPIDDYEKAKKLCANNSKVSSNQLLENKIIELLNEE